MYKPITSLFIFLACTFCFVSEASAQNQSLSDRSFGERLWYGGGFALGFSGGSGFSVLQLGVSPIVGYKFTNRWSAGPRIATLVSFYSAETVSGNRANAQPVNWGLGLFTRYKITAEIFGHLEYEYADEAVIQRQFDDLEVLRVTNDNVYIGAGYSSGRGPSKFEILGLYNLNQNLDSFDSPFSLRFGFTRNF